MVSYLILIFQIYMFLFLSFFSLILLFLLCLKYSASLILCGCCHTFLLEWTFCLFPAPTFIKQLGGLKHDCGCSVAHSSNPLGRSCLTLKFSWNVTSIKLLIPLPPSPQEDFSWASIIFCISYMTVYIILRCFGIRWLSYFHWNINSVKVRQWHSVCYPPKHLITAS